MVHNALVPATAVVSPHTAPHAPLGFAGGVHGVRYEGMTPPKATTFQGPLPDI
jgi:hypothetical protein